ncbi:structural protein [Acinetobacter phage vB_AbaP_PMK34]|uniref:Structural protein n=1 Tax=Acinetobacter phage vB_AbaP_PMK34 TaxID=2653640 RepID=A0A6M3A3D9_9CAUD|nr:structural protein [Acinetobacter phage vB_AbaP_PMK34]
MVVQFEAVGREIIGQVFALAEELKQDAIAVWIHNDVNGGIGQLIGRYNYVWGEFNADYFAHI